MRQIIWNLASNAIKFTPKRGRIKIALRAFDSSYQISVEDNGAGIAPGQLQRIFERFAQSFDRDASIGGLGLGLSIAKSLVELHGGSIYAMSPGLNQGATFVATFPISALKFPRQEQTALADAPAPVKALEGVRILVAEDTEDAALALEFVLKKAGALPVVVHDGEAALQAFTQQPFDIILSDIGMPKMDGIELITRIRSLEKARQSAPTPAIALTAYATSKDRIRCLSAGFGSHIAKPVDREELFAVIESLGVRPA